MVHYTNDIPNAVESASMATNNMMRQYHPSSPQQISTIATKMTSSSTTMTRSKRPRLNVWFTSFFIHVDCCLCVWYCCFMVKFIDMIDLWLFALVGCDLSFAWSVSSESAFITWFFSSVSSYKTFIYFLEISHSSLVLFVACRSFDGEFSWVLVGMPVFFNSDLLVNSFS